LANFGSVQLAINNVGVFIMSNPENNDDGATSKYITTILVVIGCVIIWIVLQSVIGVPMMM